MKQTFSRVFFKCFYLWLCVFSLSLDSSPSAVECPLDPWVRCLLFSPLAPFSPLELLSPSRLDEHPSLCLDLLSPLPPLVTVPFPPLDCRWEWWWRCSFSPVTPPPLPSSTELWGWCFLPPSLLWDLSLLPSLLRLPSWSLDRLWCTWWWCPDSPLSFDSSLVLVRSLSLFLWWRRGWWVVAAGSAAVSASSGTQDLWWWCWWTPSTGPSCGSTSRGRSWWVFMSGRIWRAEDSLRRSSGSSSLYRASQLVQFCLLSWFALCSHTDIVFIDFCCSLLSGVGRNNELASLKNDISR